LSLNLKPVLVLAASIVIFAGAVFLADLEQLDYVRTHFYNPSIVKSVIKENQRNAELVQNHIYELRDQFALTLNEPAVRGSFLYSQNADDIYERSKLFGILLETVSGLQYVQFIDSNGIRIHYSTSARDIISQSGEATAYRNYTEDSRYLPYDDVSVPANENGKFTMDEANDRIIFSFPFFDSMDVYRGTALFSLSVRALAEKLIAEGGLKASDDVSVIRTPPGFVFGSPDTSKTEILEKVSAIWKDGLQEYAALEAEDSGVKFALISAKTTQELFFGRLINDSVFSIPDSMKLILQISMFLTLYLTLFFIVNFRPAPATLVKNRIKTLRANLFEQLYVNKSSQERTKWILELEQRREEIRAELKNNVKIKPGMEKDIDGMIDKAWDELLAIIKSGSGSPSPVSTTVTAGKDEAEGLEEIGEVEELGEVEEIGEVEELGEIEEAEEVEELGEIEEVEEAEELGEIEEIGEVEEISEVEEIGEAEELGEIEEVEEVEELGEIEEAEEVEELGEIEEIGEVEEISEVEEIGEAEEIEEAGKIEKTAKPGKRGLLALANGCYEREQAEQEEQETPPHRGLLAMASEIEFNREYPTGVDDDTEDLHAELNIVSPFSSMFSSLDEGNNEPEKP